MGTWNSPVERETRKKGLPKKRPGVTINRRDSAAVPVPNAVLFWRNTHVRDVKRNNGEQETKNVRIDILVEGVTNDVHWKCGLEFDYANEESFYCRPLRVAEETPEDRFLVPEEMTSIRVNLLPPMSGLADREFAKQRGEIDFLIGQGRTAEVVRNLARQLLLESDGLKRWQQVKDRVAHLFNVRLYEPEFIVERSEITMVYREASDATLDISCSGRGFQQTLLLLLYMSANPGSVLLLDEPDAHLEIVRQRQIYQVLTDVAREQNSQIIAASHSEVIMNEAANRDVVVAFVGRPHRIDDRGHQVAKSLKELGFDQYYLAEQKGWVLYVEGSTDLDILRAFAERLGHDAMKYLEQPFVHYVANLPNRAKHHFFGLREAKPDLVGYFICDRLEAQLDPSHSPLHMRMWSRREIENYLFQPQTLRAFARGFGQETAAGKLFEATESARCEAAMSECIDDFYPRAALRDNSDSWWSECKASDDVLNRVFDAYYKKLELPNQMRKSNYHVLARFVEPNMIAHEITTVLDDIVAVGKQARPIESTT